MRRTPRTVEGQGSLFGASDGRRAAPNSGRAKPKQPEAAAAPRRWRMPALEGKTVAEVRLRWPKRLTPAQVARVEAELGTLPTAMTKLGFGTVVVERSFVRRRKT